MSPEGLFVAEPRIHEMRGARERCLELHVIFESLCASSALVTRPLMSYLGESKTDVGFHSEIGRSAQVVGRAEHSEMFSRSPVTLHVS